LEYGANRVNSYALLTLQRSSNFSDFALALRPTKSSPAKWESRQAVLKSHNISLHAGILKTANAHFVRVQRQVRRQILR
jgi:hypothetical protein